MNRQRLLALLLVFTLLPGFCAAALASGDGQITVSLRIEGPGKCLYYNERCDFSVKDGANTVADFLKSMQYADDFPAVTLAQIDGCASISDIGGLVEAPYADSSGWFFLLNGKKSDADITGVALKRGDELVIYYADRSAGILFPTVDSSRLLTDGILRFTSGDDGAPLAGATVEYDKVAMVTDENGEIAVPQYNMLAGMHYLQIGLYDEATGAPLVMRYAPDYMMFVPYADMESGAWYARAVEYCVVKRLMNGVGDNRFAPNEKMTMAQLIMLLCRIAGRDTTPAAGDLWYSAALTWAEESGILPDMTYKLSDSVSRELFIYMFYKTAGLDGKTDMDKRAVITAAVDYEQISRKYIAAVEWAVAAGLIIGVGGDNEGLVIDPATPASRAVVCQMLLRYYVLAAG